MTKTTLLLATAILVGLALPALAERGQGPRAAEFERPTFSEIDVNGDGQITAEELQNRAAARFAAADADGDGLLSAAEIAAAAEARARRSAEDRAAYMIERLDDNGDGLLSQDELAARGRGDRAARMISRLDSDGDGAVSEDEFDRMAKRMRDGRGPRGGQGGWQ